MPAPELTATGTPDIVYFAVSNPEHGATYEWEVNGLIRPEAHSPEIFVMPNGQIVNRYITYRTPVSTNALSSPVTFTARCRAVLNGIKYEWSNYAQGTIQ
jgi:hypothetical protein